MPPLLCPSPQLLDQSFPRGQAELLLVATALGEIERCLSDNSAGVILTGTLQSYIELFDFQRTEPYPLLTDIYQLLVRWFLQPHSGIVRVPVETVLHAPSHPVPAECQHDALVEVWADEVGRILVLHDRYCSAQEFFIGVACARGFAGEPLGQYSNPHGIRAFPLVAPGDLGDLEDAYRWDVPQDFTGRLVSFEDAKKNCPLLGAKEVREPHGGSHYQVKFPVRTWPLDKNYPYVPERYLRELVAITGYPLSVVKYALITGKLPPRVLRLPL